jgi:hypothetical protein
MDDGSIIDVTWCDRCGELLAPKNGQGSHGRLYPALDVIHMYLSWDRAALPAGQYLADAAAHVLGRLSNADFRAGGSAQPCHVIAVAADR